MNKKLYYQINNNTLNKKNKSKMLVEVELVERRGNGIAEVCVIKPVKGFGQISVKESTLKIL